MSDKCPIEPYTETREPENVESVAPETFRDRLKREHPKAFGSDFLGGCKGCPYKYKYEPKPKKCDNVSEHTCRICWDRPVPEK